LKAIGDTADSGFDVVVSDQHMEAVGGILKGSELIERLVARNFDRCPVLAIASANTDEHDNAKYFASGTDIVWPKPYPQNAQLARDILQIWNSSMRKQMAVTSTKRSSNKVVPMA
jgi:CheY-like chemotaxis protein